MLNSNDYDIIKYIISRIRSQWNSNTEINDTLLVEVAKLTATVAQNSNNLSPKKIYSKIKKLQLPKERDEFLVWYQNYLESTVFGGNNRIAKIKSSTSLVNKVTSHAAQEHVGAPQPPPPPTDDGDLAEADQSGGGSLYLEAEDTQNSLIMINSESNEVENSAIDQITNSQPEGACALISPAVNQAENHLANPSDI